MSALYGQILYGEDRKDFIVGTEEKARGLAFSGPISSAHISWLKDVAEWQWMIDGEEIRDQVAKENAECRGPGPILRAIRDDVYPPNWGNEFITLLEHDKDNN